MSEEITSKLKKVKEENKKMLVISDLNEVMGIREYTERKPTKALNIAYLLGKKGIDVGFFSDVSHFGASEKVIMRLDPDLFTAEEISDKIFEFLSGAGGKRK